MIVPELVRVSMKPRLPIPKLNVPAEIVPELVRVPMLPVFSLAIPFPLFPTEIVFELVSVSMVPKLSIPYPLPPAEIVPELVMVSMASSINPTDVVASPELATLKLVSDKEDTVIISRLKLVESPELMPLWMVLVDALLMSESPLQTALSATLSIDSRYSPHPL